MKEQWRPVRRCPGYEVSDLGRVRSWRNRHDKRKRCSPILMKPTPDQNGYLRLTLCPINGKRVTLKVHRMVLEAFIGPCPLGHEARHYPDSTTRTDNRLGNLRWGTKLEQWADQVLDGTAVIGERNGRAKLTNAKVKEIRRLLATGRTEMYLAKRFGVNASTISRIRTGRNWR